MQENQEIDSRVEEFEKEENSLIEGDEIKNNLKRQWVVLTLIGMVVFIIIVIFINWYKKDTVQ